MLQVLIHLRYLAVAGQVLTIFFVSQRLGLGIPAVALLCISAGMLAFNLLTHAWARTHTASSLTLGLQLLVDMLALTALLYLSGGPSNPFVSLYLVPVALAAICLEIGPMLALTILSALLYTVLLRHHVPLPTIHGRDFEFHVLGMWANFLLTAVIMVVTLSRFMALVKEQRRALSVARERALRDESLLAIGSLAAGTAHELNTPLATMGLLVDDWSTTSRAPSAEDLAMMREQLAHCRDHVRALVDIARQRETDEPVVRVADEFIRECVDRWLLLRPSARVTLATDTGKQRLRVDATLPQALTNLFNNAADANSGGDSEVEITTEVRGPRLLLRILDRGPGPEAISLRSAPLSGTGLGIGLLISNASIERNLGVVRQYRREGGGCVTEVELPWAGVPS